MAVAFSAIGAAELALLAKDRPIIGANIIPRTPTVERWTEVGAITDTDRTETGYPVHRVYDGDPDVESKPNGARDPYYVVFDLGAAYTIDFVCIIGHNLSTAGVVNVDLDIDYTGDTGDGSFGSYYRAPVSTNPSSDDRIMQLDLMHTGTDALRYTGVRYVRLRLNKGSAFTPQINELVIGHRRQLKTPPKSPFNPQQWMHDQTVAKSRGHSIDITQWSRNAFVLDASFSVWQDAYITDIKEWWKQVYGSFIWIWEPYTYPDSWHLMALEQDVLIFPSEGFTERTLEVHAVEQGPETWLLENE